MGVFTVCVLSRGWPGAWLVQGARWRRRRPRWLMLERVRVHGLWRASQAAFRGAWASTACTQPSLPMLPGSLKVPTPGSGLPRPLPVTASLSSAHVWNPVQSCAALEHVLLGC